MQENGEETVTTHYSLCDTVYAKAQVECNGIVCLWLGVRPPAKQGLPFVRMVGSAGWWLSYIQDGSK